MTTGHVYIATSRDGFVARKDHSLDWLMKQESGPDDMGFTTFMDSVDGLVMGSGSFRTVAGFDDWPYTKPVVVMSNSMSQDDIRDDLQDKVRLTNLAPQELMTELAQQGWSRAYIDGGRVVQSFLRAELIEDMVVTIVPILIGEGLSLFGPLDHDIDLKLVRADTFDNGMLQTTYAIKQSE